MNSQKKYDQVIYMSGGKVGICHDLNQIMKF